MARKVKHPEHVNHERWLVSYADFITLLFATFTMLFAISNVEKDKLKQAAQSLNKAFGGATSVVTPTIITPRVLTTGNADAGSKLNIIIFPNASQPNKASTSNQDANAEDAANDDARPPIAIAQITPLPGATPDDQASSVSAVQPAPTPTPAQENNTPGAPEGTGNAAMASRLRQLLSDLGLRDKVDVREEKRGTVISLGEAAFFNPGEVEVKPSSAYQLDKIANALRDQHFEIRIEGHTDTTPVTSGRYSSNLELSTLRATHIVDFMIKQYRFPPALLSAAGYGELRPVADNATPDGRQKNRRVDIVILNQQMMAQEPQPYPAGR